MNERSWNQYESVEKDVFDCLACCIADGDEVFERRIKELEHEIEKLEQEIAERDARYRCGSGCVLVLGSYEDIHADFPISDNRSLPDVAAALKVAVCTKDESFKDLGISMLMQANDAWHESSAIVLASTP